MFHAPAQLEFLAPGGQLLPREARRLGIRAISLDSFDIAVRALPAQRLESFLLGEEMEDSLGTLPVVHRWHRVRAMDSLTHWTAWVDLDSLSRALGGPYLVVEASAPPEAVRPRMPSKACDTLRATHVYLVGSLGMIGTVLSDSMQEVVVYDQTSGAPLENARVQAMGPGGELRMEGRSDRDGRVVLRSDSLHSVVATTPTMMARAVVSEDGTTRNWQWGEEKTARQVSIRQDEGRWMVAPDGIRLFPYTLRGVHRPGDSVVVGCLVRGPGFSIPQGNPLRWSLRDPTGRVVDSFHTRVGKQGHEQWRLATTRAATTGSWEVVVRVDEALGSSRFRIEVDPARQLRVDDPMLQAAHGQSRFAVGVGASWLSGRPAEGLRVTWKVRLEPKYTPTRTYPAPWDRVRGRVISSVPREEFDTTIFSVLSAGGRSRLEFEIPAQLRRVPYLKLQVQPVVFPPGGRGVPGNWVVSSIGLAPVPHLRLRSSGDSVVIAGVLGTWKDSLEAGHSLRVRIDTGTAGTLCDSTFLSGDSIRFALSWWKARVRDTTWDTWFRVSLRATDDTSLRVEDRYRFGATGIRGKFGMLDLDDRTWSPSRVAVEADSADPRTLHEDSVIRAQARRELDPLSLGDTARLSWEAESPGMALVQVIQGNRILEQSWVATRRGRNEWSRVVGEEWAPGASVVVHDLAPRGSGMGGDLLRQEGKTFAVVPDSLAYEIVVVDSLRPLSTGIVRVRDRAGRGGEFVLGATDQGILDLDHHPVPDPLPSMWDPEQIGVAWWGGMGSWDRCQFCRNGNSCELSDEQAAAIGIGAMSGFGSGSGSGMALGAGGHGRGMSTRGSHNRLKREARPMAWVSRVLELPPQGREVRFPIPAYTGEIRLTAVGASGRSMGASSLQVPVRSPLELSWTAPLRLAPGDVSTATLSILGGRPGAGRLRVRTHGALESLSDTLADIVLDSLRQARWDVQVRASRGVGEGWIEAEVEQGADRMRKPVSLHVQDGRFQGVRTASVSAKGGRTRLPLATRFLEGTESGRLEVVLDAHPGVDRRIGQLLTYPHGCVEQTTSIAWPQLHLARLLDPRDTVLRDIARRHVREAIARLDGFRTSSGLLSLWPGESQPYVWGSLWAAGFLVEAEAAGFRLPHGLLPDLLDGLRSRGMEDMGPLERATWMALLADEREEGAADTTTDTTALHSLSRQEMTQAARWTLAKAWAREGFPARAREEAGRAGIPGECPRELGGTLRSTLRDQALVLEAMVELDRVEGRDSLLESVWAAVSGPSWLSTQELAMALRALAAADPADSVARPANAKSKVRWRADQGRWQVLDLSRGRASVDLPPGASSISLEWPEKRRRLSAEATRSGLVLEPAAVPDSGLSLELAWKLPGDREVSPAAIPSQTEFVCKATVRNPSRRPLPNAALTLWLPAGWEIRNDRLEAARAGRREGASLFRDLREDRYIEHFDLAPEETRVIEVPLMAVQPGRYHGPQVEVEALYQESIRARRTLPAVEVTPAP